MKDNLQMLEMKFSGYEYTNTIPEYIEKINRSNNFIEWGKDNLYPEYLISLVNRSPLHNAIVNLKSNMIGGNGFVNVDWKPKTINFIKNINNIEDLETINTKIAKDLTIFGGFYLEIIWSKDRNSIAEINYINPSTVRIVPSEDEKYPDRMEFDVCDDWKNFKKESVGVVRYTSFSTKDRSKPSQILYVRHYTPSNNFYPVPEYLGGIPLMELNYEINQYHLATIRNGFAPSMQINIPYIPQSNEELEDYVKRQRAGYQGSKKAGNVYFTFYDDPAKTTTITPIQLNDSDKKYQELTKSMMDGIVSAHSLTDKKLLGLEIAGELGGSKNERIEALSVFQAMYVSIHQTFIEKVWNMLGRINDIEDKIILQKYSSNLTPDLPIGELVSLLTSELPERNKVEILISKGYDRSQADLLVNGTTKEVKPPIVEEKIIG